MSTSAIDRPALPTAFATLVISAFVAIFGAVYECFSHGVWSGYMVYAFMIPLLLDAVPFTLLALRCRPMPGRWVLNFHHAGVATLTVGSIFEGVLVIYGTTHPMTMVYWIVGPVLLLLGLLTHLLRRRDAE